MHYRTIKKDVQIILNALSNVKIEGTLIVSRNKLNETFWCSPLIDGAHVLDSVVACGEESGTKRS